MLNTRSIFDPRWQQGLGRVNNGAQTSLVLVRRPIAFAGVDTPHPATWDYDQGKYVKIDASENGYQNLWLGPARVQPDKDWRARSYMFGDESTVFQAVRIVLPLGGGDWSDTLPEDERGFRDQDEVLILTNFFPGLDPILKYIFVVRNPLGSGVAPVQNLLCDVNLKGGVSRGNPQ